eukprot:6191142-Pleurochrysis_carterae.AAC.1
MAFACIARCASWCVRRARACTQTCCPGAAHAHHLQRPKCSMHSFACEQACRAGWVRRCEVMGALACMYNMSCECRVQDDLAAA